MLLTTVGTISLTRMRVLNSGTTSIKVNGATGFTLDHSVVQDSAGNGTDGGTTDEGLYLLNVLRCRDFPYKPSTTAIWSNDQGISRIRRLGFEVSDCTEGKSIGGHVFEYSEPVIHGRTFWTRYECGFGW